MDNFRSSASAASVSVSYRSRKHLNVTTIPLSHFWISATRGKNKYLYLVFPPGNWFLFAQKSLTSGWEIIFDQPNFQEGYKIEVFIFATRGSTRHILAFWRKGIWIISLKCHNSHVCTENKVTSYYKRFNTGNGEILPCVGCNQLPFRVTLLVVTRYFCLSIESLIVASL